MEASGLRFMLLVCPNLVFFNKIMRLYLNNKIKSNTVEICHSVILVWTGVYLLNKLLTVFNYYSEFFKLVILKTSTSFLLCELV